MKNTLETARLIIRNFQEDDWKDLHAYLSLPETYIYEPGEPISVDQAKGLAEDRSKGDAFLAVILKAENKMIGHLYFDLMEPQDFLTWELGFIFNPEFQNRGYCTEASRRVIEYGFGELAAHRIAAFCDPRNHASSRVLEKIGMRREGHFRKKAFFRRDANGTPLWHDAYAYGIVEDEVSSRPPAGWTST
jgi:RimJ/RimL family protein N-acetyltransferase